jgi:DNA-binding MurR/RpiR family transcriptional regulator
MTPTPSDIEARLRQLMPETRGPTADAIQFLIMHQDEIPFRSMRELAKRADVPPVTLVRLAQSLGFKGYEDFRGVFVTAMIDGQGRNQGRAAELVSLGRKEGALSFAVQFAEREFEVQRATIANLKEVELKAAVQAVVDAERVFVIGRRPFFAAAYSLYYSLRKVKPDTQLLDSGGGSGLEFGTMSGKDVVIAFSTYPYSRVTLAVAQNASNRGAKVIAITDSENAPISLLADHVFLTTVRSYAFSDSIAGAYLIGNLLVALAVSALGSEALEQIQRNEDDIRESGEYVANPPRKIFGRRSPRRRR